MPQIRRVFPDARFVHVVRDGRDVAASFVRLGPHDLAGSADIWLRAIQSAQTFSRRHPGALIQVKYEDLVRSPESVLRPVCAFLNFSFDERMLRHHEMDLELGDVDVHEHLREVREPVHARSIGHWRQQFGDAEAAELNRRLGYMLNELGYSVRGEVSARSGRVR
jgi:hypothetical protein